MVLYGKIVTVLAPGLFFESMWTKVCQANGDMKTPMYGQILGAIVNIVLDPILIFFQFYSYVLEMTLQIFLKHLQVPSL